MEVRAKEGIRLIELHSHHHPDVQSNFEDDEDIRLVKYWDFSHRERSRLQRHCLSVLDFRLGWQPSGRKHFKWSLLVQDFTGRMVTQVIHPPI